MTSEPIPSIDSARSQPSFASRFVGDLGLIRIAQAGLVGVALSAWCVLTAPGMIPNLYFDNDDRAAFFFGEPAKVAKRLVHWFLSGEIFPHLAVTLIETLAAFFIGTAAGLVVGVALALSPRLSKLLSPFITAANAMPRVVLAPIFALWFGLGMTSKVALAITLVFFLVFFNAFHGVLNTPQVVVLNTRMLGASRSQLVRRVFLPSAASWVFSSLHNAVGIAFVGAVIGEYLGSSRGIGYLILQAEGAFDINGVISGILVLTVCALLLDAGVTLVERRLLKWRPPNQRGTQ